MIVLGVFDIVFAIEPVHEPDVDKDDGDKHQDGALLSEPKSEFEPAKPHRIQFIGKQDARLSNT